jgi:hypothetical protein
MPAPHLPDEEFYRQRERPRPVGGRLGLGLVLVVVGLVLLAFQLSGRGFALGGGTIDLVDQTLPGSRIELTAAASDVAVRIWDGPGIRVEAIQTGGSRGDYQVDVSTSGDTVRVSESGRGPFWCLFCVRGLRYEISVPAGAQAAINTASGDIDAEDVDGAVTLGTTSGDVRADNLAGGAHVETSSGEVRLNDVAGPLSVTTISGDVRLEDGAVDGATVKTTSGEIDMEGVAGELRVNTVSGDIKVADARDAVLTFGTTSGEITFDGALARAGANGVSSISGDIRLRLPDDADFRLDASTVSGDINNEFELQGAETGLRSLSGTAGDGGSTLNVSTTSGEIAIERR